jgi:hypothetical protein
LSEDLGQVGSKSGLAITAYEFIELFGWILVLGKWPYNRQSGSNAKMRFCPDRRQSDWNSEKLPTSQLNERIALLSTYELRSGTVSGTN